MILLKYCFLFTLIIQLKIQVSRYINEFENE